MIFLTVGTHEPFDRLVRAVDDWCMKSACSEVFGQITEPGSSGYRPKYFDWVATLTPDAYDKEFRSAGLVVAHAGMGSIITALSYAKPIVVLPRKGDLRETRNDHQVATAHRLMGRPGIHVALDESDLPRILEDLMERGGSDLQSEIGPFAEPPLIKAVRSAILGTEP